MKRMTKKAWFGPRRWGWGWQPASWEGWVVTIAFAIIGQAVKKLSPKRAALATLALVAAYLGVMILTGDPPGHRRNVPASSVEEVAPIAA